MNERCKKFICPLCGKKTFNLRFDVLQHYIYMYFDKEDNIIIDEDKIIKGISDPPFYPQIELSRFTKIQEILDEECKGEIP